MKLTVQQVFVANQILVGIINANRPMPTKGAYRIARLHAKLQVELKPISDKRDEIIKSYGYQGVPDGAPEGFQPVDMVPPDKAAEFELKWREIADEEIEVDVQPIPLSQLSLGDDEESPISAGELFMLAIW
jgi:hypothetical protein